MPTRLLRRQRGGQQRRQRQRGQLVALVAAAVANRQAQVQDLEPAATGQRHEIAAREHRCGRAPRRSAGGGRRRCRCRRGRSPRTKAGRSANPLPRRSASRCRGVRCAAARCSGATVRRHRRPSAAAPRHVPPAPAGTAGCAATRCAPWPRHRRPARRPGPARARLRAVPSAAPAASAPLPAARTRCSITPGAGAGAGAARLEARRRWKRYSRVRSARHWPPGPSAVLRAMPAAVVRSFAHDHGAEAAHTARCGRTPQRNPRIGPASSRRRPGQRTHFERPHRAQHRRQGRRTAPGRARIPRVSDPGQAGHCRDQADGQPARPGAGLLARRGRGLRGDRHRPGQRLPLHRARQPGGGDHQWHRGAGPGRYRAAGRQAGDGRQGRAVQEVRRYRCLRHRGQREERRPAGRGDRRAGAHLRRHQSGGHQGAGLLRRRAQAARAAEDSGLPRRPARHRHRRRRGAAECAEGGGQGHRQRQAGGQRCRRCGACLPGAAAEAGAASARTSGSPTWRAWSGRAAPS